MTSFRHLGRLAIPPSVVNGPVVSGPPSPAVLSPNIVAPCEDFGVQLLLPRPATKEWGEDRGEGQSKTNAPSPQPSSNRAQRLARDLSELECGRVHRRCHPARSGSPRRVSSVVPDGKCQLKQSAGTFHPLANLDPRQGLRRQARCAFALKAFSGARANPRPNLAKTGQKWPKVATQLRTLPFALRFLALNPQPPTSIPAARIVQFQQDFPSHTSPGQRPPCPRCGGAGVRGVLSTIVLRPSTGVAASAALCLCGKNE
jgi:hypothetical protein